MDNHTLRNFERYIGYRPKHLVTTKRNNIIAITRSGHVFKQVPDGWNLIPV